MANTTRAELLVKLAAKFPQLSMANPTNSDIYAILLEVLAAYGSPASRAITAAATTGTPVLATDEYVIVTSGNSAHIVYLPAVSEVSPGKKIILEAGATAFELSTGAVGDLLNNVASSVGVKSAAIPATGLAVCTAVSAAETGTVAGWQLQYYTELGALATAIVPD